LVAHFCAGGLLIFAQGVDPPDEKNAAPIGPALDPFPRDDFFHHQAPKGALDRRDAAADSTADGPVGRPANGPIAGPIEQGQDDRFIDRLDRRIPCN
jgi:hypothetical protein